MFRFFIFYCLKIWQKFERKVCLLRGRRGGNISWQTQIRSSNVIYQQTLNRPYQPRWNINKSKWKNACPLYIIFQGLKFQRLKIIYKIQPPSLFISYLLSYIFLVKGFTQGDCVVSCTKMNFHNHYPLHLQNWTSL